jgi:hypothetical protein
MKQFTLVVLTAALLIGCSIEGDDLCAIGADWSGVVDLSVSFEGFDEHVGQLFELRTVASGDTIDAVAVPAIPGAEFSVTLEAACLETNLLEFYADVNGNGDYDPPPTDHAWRIAIEDPDLKHDTLVFRHDTNHVDIEW